MTIDCIDEGRSTYYTRDESLGYISSKEQIMHEYKIAIIIPQSKADPLEVLFVFLCFHTSWLTIFQSCKVDFLSSWVEPLLSSK